MTKQVDLSKQETLFDLVQQAKAMLADRPRIEADLIYYVAKFDSEERAAIILAYDLLYKNPESPVDPL